MMARKIVGQVMIKCPECAKIIQVEIMLTMKKYAVQDFKMRAVKREVTISTQ